MRLLEVPGVDGEEDESWTRVFESWPACRSILVILDRIPVKEW